MSEVRRDIATDTWVIIDTGGAELPRVSVDHDDDGPKPCPFDGGNESQTPPEIFAVREPGSALNGPGWRVRVVPNKNPILRIEGQLEKSGVGVYDMVTGIGANEVIIETPEHIANMCDLAVDQIKAVLLAYRSRIIDLQQDKRFRYVLVFKNYGRLAGASTVIHTHSDLIALPATPVRVKMKLNGAREYYDYKERCLYCDILQQEIDMAERIVFQTEGYAVITPYASRFPFEMMVLPKDHAHAYRSIGDECARDLADVLKRTLLALRTVAGDPPYNLILNDTPNLLPRSDYWQTIEQDYHWHIEILPRIYRTTGFELGTGFHINRLPPERAAAMLRAAL